MTGSRELDIFILGVIFGFGLYLCVDLSTAKKHKADDFKYPDPPSRLAKKFDKDQ